MEKYVVLEKQIGETPLSCAEAWRAAAGVAASVPLAYAGRLDPMASGKLLILIGDECKNQTTYHGLDKGYDFSVLFGIESDSLDVLGRLSTQSPTILTPSLPRRPSQTLPPQVGHSLGLPATEQNSHSAAGDQVSDCVRLGLAARSAQDETFVTGCSTELETAGHNLTGEIELPYPRFSAKTIHGKPLHMWTLEGRLDEIEIPTKASVVYSLEYTGQQILSREQVCDQARAKIDTIPEVTDERKVLGNDFRRVDVRADWEQIKHDDSLPEQYLIAHFHCVASSGTYMRSLASMIARELGTCGLAWHIHRTDIGTYDDQIKKWRMTF